MRVLNQNQIRRLTIRLGRMRAEARDLLEDLDHTALPSAPFRDELSAELKRLIAAVEAAAHTLDLDLRQVDVGLEQRIRIWASLWHTRILDCRPATMRSLGPVGKVATLTLDPAVEELASTLTKIAALAAPPGELPASVD